MLYGLVNILHNIIVWKRAIAVQNVALKSGV